MTLRKKLTLSYIVLFLLPFILFGMLAHATGAIPDSGPGSHERGGGPFFLFWMIFTFVGVHFFLSFTVSRSIVRPLKKLQNAAREIGDGNLDFTFLQTQTPTRCRKPRGKCRRHRDEFSEVMESFEEMRVRLSGSLKEREAREEELLETIAAVSHDLRTPLAAIRGYADGLADGVANTPEKQERYFRQISGKVVLMEHLISQLNWFSRLEFASRGEAEALPEMDLAAAAVAWRDEFAADYPEAEILLMAEADAPVLIHGDALQLRRLAGNLVENGLRYNESPEKKIEICLDYDTTAGHVLLKVRDNGIGVSEEHRQHLFDRFYRVDAERTSGRGGTGLGLAIVRRIAERHGGQVSLESEPGAGSTVTLTLPGRV